MSRIDTPTSLSAPPKRGWWFCPKVPPNKWKAKWVEVMLFDGTTTEVHWACDLSGEEQPPFIGWFNRSYRKVEFKRIMFWRQLNDANSL
jgi:hypothetical protein